MRTTLNIDGSLLKRTEQLTGISEKTTLIRRGLEALVALESARRLAKLGGTESALRLIPAAQRPDGPRRHLRVKTSSSDLI